MFRRAAGLVVLVSLVVLAISACAPAAAPTATPTKAPAAAPTKAAEAAKPAAATAPPAATATAPAATATKPAPSPTVAPTTLKFAYVEALSNLPVFIAMDRGYFKEQGINIELVPVQSTTAAFPSMGTGELDFTSTAISPAQLNAVERGVPLKILATTGRSRPGYDFIWIVLRKDLADSGQVKSAADLKGMKVGLNAKGTAGELTMQRLLEQAGLKLSDVEEVVMQTTDQMVALANKSIGAAPMVEPTVAQAVKTGVGTKWISSSSLLGGVYEGGIIVVGKNLLENKDLGQRFMVALLKGGRDENKAFGPEKQGRADAVNIAIKYSALKDPALYDMMEMPYADPNGEIDMNHMRLVYDFYVKGGFYSGKVRLDDVIDMSYANYAAQKLGRQ